MRGSVLRAPASWSGAGFARALLSRSRGICSDMKSAVLSGVVCCVGLSGCTTPVPDHPALAPVGDRPLIIAHKGGDGLMPANTMAAFRNAVKVGADVLEFDVHASSDGVLVAIHDETLDRTTEAAGLVKARTFAELRALDAGYDWPTLREAHHPAGTPWRGQGLKIPAVEEILERFLDARLAIEIKQETPPIAEPLCLLLRWHKAEERTIVGAFSQTVLDDFRKHCPEVATSASQSEATRFFGLNAVFLAGVASLPALALQIPQTAQGLTVVTPSLIRAAKARNIDVHVWTVNAPEDMRRLVEMGVDGIITDYPDRLAAILERTPEVSTLAAPAND